MQLQQKIRRQTVYLLSPFLLLSLLAGCAAGESPAGQSEAVCSLDALSVLPDVRLGAVTHEDQPVSHCKVAGVIGTETNFELLLPDAWNGEFVMGAGGGFVGSVVNAAQDFFGALQMGYAAAGTDTGHQAHSLDASWALNNLERLVSFPTKRCVVRRLTPRR